MPTEIMQPVEISEPVWITAIGSMIEPSIICAVGETYTYGEMRAMILNGISSLIFCNSENLTSGFPIAKMMFLYSQTMFSKSAQVPTTLIPYGIVFLSSSTKAILSKYFTLSAISYAT